MLVLKNCQDLECLQIHPRSRTLITRLSQVTRSKTTTDVDAKVLDGAVIIHMLRPRGCRFFADYAQNIFKPFIISSLDKVKRLDVIWDRYLANSLKQSTCEKRMHLGTVQRQRVLSTSPIPSNWESFFRIEKNKDKLFHYLSKSMKNFGTSGWIPYWIDLKDATKSCQELMRCSCITRCKIPCKSQWDSLEKGDF